MPIAGRLSNALAQINLKAWRHSPAMETAIQGRLEL
jgi:hypothetical protein